MSIQAAVTFVNPVNSHRRGIAMVVALFFACCLMVMFVAMFFQQRNVSSHNRLSMQKTQAYFAARAAVQHFLLKARLFPTELYDAVEFAQGKNPLCDFSEFERVYPGSNAPRFRQIPSHPRVFAMAPEDGGSEWREADINKNPKYFYMPIEGRNEAFIRIGSYYNPDYRYLGPNFAPSNLEDRYTKPVSPPDTCKSGKFLSYFTRDCNNQMTVQPQLVINKAPDLQNIQTWDLSYTPDQGFPYMMQYQVLRVNIQAMEGLRKYNEEAIEIEVEGIIEDFQGKRYKQVQRKIQRINRRGSVGGGS